MLEIFTKEQIAAVYQNLVRKKTADRNKKLPIGIDGVSSEVFERNFNFSLNEIYRKLLVQNGKIGYLFAPLLRIEKTKSKGGTRSLHIPRLRDQVVFRLLHNEIQKVSFAQGIDLRVKSPYSYIQSFDRYTQNFPNSVILKTDIVQFYDTIPREFVLNLCKKLGLRQELYDFLKSWSEHFRIRHANFDLQTEFHPSLGLPQGLSISSLLAELYAKQIDHVFSTDSGYFRYIDDIVIVCSDFESAYQKLANLKQVVEDLGLKLSSQKTEVLRLKNGFEWLGLIHFPGCRRIHSDKLIKSMKPLRGLQKACLYKVTTNQSELRQSEAIKDFICQVDKYICGSKKVRLKWYSLIEDEGQWRLMDKYIHGLIYSCIRKANLDYDLFQPLPSIHSKIISYRKVKGSPIMPIKGNAPSVLNTKNAD